MQQRLILLFLWHDNSLRIAYGLANTHSSTGVPRDVPAQGSQGLSPSTWIICYFHIEVMRETAFIGISW